MNHPAEEIIGQELRVGENERALEWFRDVSLDSTRPAFAASVIRCLGRVDRPGTVAWRADIVRRALATDAVEVRDAAVQAAELWGDLNIRAVLAEHSEPAPWLRDYIRNVIDDLQG